jgi:predicted CopG family antitoxin
MVTQKVVTMGKTVKLQDSTLEKLEQHKSPGQSWDGIIREIYSKSKYATPEAQKA